MDLFTTEEFYELQERLLQEPRHLRISHYYINNTKVARFMIGNHIEYGRRYAMTGTACGSGTDTEFWLRRVGNLPGDGPQFKLFDKVVLDSIYTLIRNGYHTATLQMITKVVYGTTDKRMNKSQMDKVKNSMDRWKQASFGINFKGEFEGRGITDSHFISSTQTLRQTDWTGYLVLDKSATSRSISTNGKPAEGYHLEKGYLNQYAEAIGQILCVPFEVRDISSFPAFLTAKDCDSADDIGDDLFAKITKDVIIIRDYLISRIEQMKNSHSSIKSMQITYEWTLSSTGEAKGMFHVLGFSTDSQCSRKKKHRVHTITKRILAFFTRINYISGADLVCRRRNGSDKPVIVGWVIHTSIEPAQSREL